MMSANSILLGLAVCVFCVVIIGGSFSICISALLLCCISFLVTFGVIHLAISEAATPVRQMSENEKSIQQQLKTAGKVVICLLSVLVSKLVDLVFFVLSVRNARDSVSNRSSSFGIIHCGDSPIFRQEIRSWVNLITEHHIKTWYDEVSVDQNFINDFKFLLEDTLIKLSQRMSAVKSTVFVNNCIHLLQDHVKKTSSAFSTKSFHGQFQNESSRAVTKHFALSSPVLERCYLKTCTIKLLELVAPKDIIACPSPKIIATDLLADAVVLPLVDIISDPEWINWSIVRLCSGDGALSRFIQSPEYEKARSLSVKSTDSAQHKHLSTYKEGPKYENLKKFHDTNASDSCYELTPSTTSESSSEIYRAHKVTPKCPPNDSRISQRNKRNIFKSESSFRIETMHHPSDSGVVTPGPRTLRRSFSCNDLTPNQYSNSSSSGDRESEQEESSDWMPYPLWLSRSNSVESEAPVTQPEASDEAMVEEGEDVALFTNVSIPNTEQRIEPGTGPYTLYRIQYDGLFEEPPEDANGPSQLSRRTITVLRRFREFHNLQTRLEENPMLKNTIKGFLKPSKWDTLLKSSCSKQVVAQRQKFLQKYLQQLCASEPVANSRELHQFLAYGTDARVAYTRKAPLLPIPRIDKIVMGGMKGAIGIIKATLPNTPEEGKCETSPMNKIDELIQQQQLHSKVSPKENIPSQERRIEFQISNFELKVQHFLASLNLSLESDDTESLHKPKLLNSNSKSETNMPFPDDASLACSILDMFASLLSGNISSDVIEIPTYMILLKTFLGPAINGKLQQLLDYMTTEEKCAYYAHIMHESLWGTDPDGISFNNRIKNWKEIGMEEAHVALRLLLKKYMPSFFLQHCEKIIYHLLRSLQNTELNRSLIYSVLDHLIETLDSEELPK